MEATETCYLAGYTAWEVGYIVVVFLLGGLVKGAVGFGLPQLTIPLLAFVFPVPEAVALSVVPMFASNLLQATTSRHLGSLVSTYWVLLLTLAVSLAISVRLMVWLEPEMVRLAVGAAAIAYVTLELSGVRLAFLSRRNAWTQGGVGIVSGVIGGATAFFGLTAILYLVSQDLDKNRFVDAVSIMLLSGALVLIASLSGLGVVGVRELLISGACCLPLVVGMRAGRRLRDGIDPRVFRRLILVLVFATGASMILRAIVG